MPYNNHATKTILDLIGLSPACQQVTDLWLSLWDGNTWPSQEVFLPSRLGALEPNTLFCTLAPDDTARITSFGSQLANWAGHDLLGSDMMDIATEHSRPERMRRLATVAKGSIMRATRYISRQPDEHLVAETVSLPLWADPDTGTTTLVYFTTGLPTQGAEGALEDLGREPDTVEFVPIIVNALPKSPEALVSKSLKPEERIKTISRAVMRLLLGVLADTLSAYPDADLDPLDFLIAFAIGNANISHIENDPILRRQYAGLIEPDAMRRGLSRAAVSRALAVPLETVRRRINRMVEMGILIENPDGVILSANNPFKLDSNTARMHVHAQLTDRMWRELKARGVTL